MPRVTLDMEAVRAIISGKGVTLLLAPIPDGVTPDFLRNGLSDLGFVIKDASIVPRPDDPFDRFDTLRLVLDSSGILCLRCLRKIEPVEFPVCWTCRKVNGIVPRLRTEIGPQDLPPVTSQTETPSSSSWPDRQGSTDNDWPR